MKPLFVPSAQNLITRQLRTWRAEYKSCGGDTMRKRMIQLEIKKLTAKVRKLNNGELVY